MMKPAVTDHLPPLLFRNIGAGIGQAVWGQHTYQVEYIGQSARGGRQYRATIRVTRSRRQVGEAIFTTAAEAKLWLTERRPQAVRSPASCAR